MLSKIVLIRGGALAKFSQYLLPMFMVAALALCMAPAQAIEYITYYHNDTLGSPIAATDENGDELWNENYQPFGERVVQDTKAGSNQLWYTGKPQDSATGLSYYGARYYDSVLGRFMGIDPARVELGNLHSFNRYAYANNNPYKFIDPDGRDAEPAEGSDSFDIIIFGVILYAIACSNSPDGCSLKGLLNENGNEEDADSSKGVQEDKSQKNGKDQIKKLSKGEIKKLKKGGEDVHDLKGGKDASKRDLFKDRDGNIEVRPKNGDGPGDPTGININDF